MGSEDLGVLREAAEALFAKALDLQVGPSSLHGTLSADYYKPFNQL